MTSVTIAGRHRTWTVSPSSSTVTNGSRESIEGSPARWKGMHQSDDSSQSEDEGEDSIYLSRGLVSYLQSQQGLDDPRRIRLWMASMMGGEKRC